MRHAHSRPVLLAAAVLPLCLVATPVAAGTAVVHFDNADRYTDTGPRRDAESVQKTLAEHLQALAAKRLPDSQTLNVTVTDVDLAGEIPPATRLPPDLRVMGKHPDWPRITLRYTLNDGSRVLAQGSEVVSDMAYLMRAGSVGQASGPLPYERRMLSDWFDSRFGKAAGH